MQAARRVLIVSDPAEADLRAIWTYIAADNPTAADGVLRRIGARMEQLIEFPYSATFDERFGVHLLPVAPYIVAYLVTEDEVQIVRVVDGRRDLNAIFSAPGEV